MNEIHVHNEMAIDGGYFVEGVPGVGLASKIATDHLIDHLDMELYATVEADGIPEVMIFEEGERELRSPVRILADEETGIYAFTSDVLISPVEADGFAPLMVDWMEENDIMPLMLSGFPSSEEGKNLYGVTTGGGGDILEEAGIEKPDQTGLVGGPTGAMMHTADDQGMDAICLVVESDPQFPDPIAAKHLIDEGVEKIVDFDVETEILTEQAEEIKEQKQKLSQLIQEAEQHEKGQAYPEGMYE